MWAGLVAAVACARTESAIDKPELIRRGDERVEKRQYADAIAAYRAVVEADPQDGETRLKLARTYVHAGRWSDAAVHGIRAGDLLPNDPDAQMFATSMMLSQGRFVDAADRAAAMRRKDPENVDALIVWANATARIVNSTWALYSLPDAVLDADEFERRRRDLRPDTLVDDDLAAERAFRQALQLDPAKTEAQLAYANFLWAAGRPDEGEKLLRSVADQLPRHAAVNHALGAYYLSRGRGAEGAQYLKRAAAEGEVGLGARIALADHLMTTNRDVEALAMLNSMPAEDDTGGEVSVRAAAVELRMGRPDDARRRLDRLLARAPGHARAFELKARIALAAGAVEEAIKNAQTAVSADPGSGEARVALGRALDAAGDSESAFEAFVEALRLSPTASQLPLELARIGLALGRNQQALDYAREAVRLLPGDPRAALALVRALVRTGDYQSAERQLKPLLAREPASAALLVELGAVHAARGNVGLAATAYERALGQDARSFDALSGVVSLELGRGQVAAARRRVDAAAAAHSGNPQYLLLSARVYSAAGDLPRAESTLRQAVASAPGHLGPGTALADLLAARQRHGEAKQVLERLVEHRPQSVDAQTSLAILLEEMGETSDARARYEQIVARNPAAGVASHRLARLYAGQGGDLSAALGLAVAAKQQLPDDPAVSDTLGWIYLRQDLPALALPHLQDAVREHPDNPTYQYHLGTAYLSMGNLPRGREAMGRALQIDPSFANAAQARAALAEAGR